MRREQVTSLEVYGLKISPILMPHSQPQEIAGSFTWDLTIVDQRRLLQKANWNQLMGIAS